MAGDEGEPPGGLGFPGDGDVVGALARADAARAARAYPLVVRTGPVFAVVEAHQGDVPTSRTDTQNMFLCRAGYFAGFAMVGSRRSVWA